MRDKGSAGRGGDRPPLVVRGGALGDFVLTLPVLRAVRHRHGRSPTLWAAGAHLTLARAGGLVGEVCRLGDPRLAAAWGGPKGAPPPPTLPGISEAYVLRPVGADEVARLRGVWGVERVHVHDPRPPAGGGIHAADHLLGAVPETRGPAVPRLDLPVGNLAEGRRRITRTVGGGHAGVVLLLPGAGAEIKRWPLDRFTALADRLRESGLAVAWVVGPVELDRWGARVDDLVPRVDDLGTLDTAAVLASATVVVGNDTGTSHLAAAVGSPVVALFGPTDDRTWGPRGPDVRVFRSPDHGPRCEVCPQPCPGEYPAPCMEAIAVATVASAALAAAGAPGENARGPDLRR